ncbi:MAG TPA: GntR family transcriptional regulator [Acidobacteriota bacterium]|jgi:DNA-binding GntR family transcriptional regulator
MPYTPYDILLERIVLGDYPPGASLNEQEIARDLRLSRTPVREAFTRLKLEGLVKIIPRGGIFVAEASVQKIREITEVRLVLEESLAQRAVEYRTEPLLGEFRGWLQALEPVWHRLTPKEWMQRDAEFHRFMDRAAANETLATHLALLRRQAVLFWGQSVDGRASLSEIINDFKQALEALAHRNAEQCGQVLRRHVLDHVERIQKYMKPEPIKVAAQEHR